jgi:hypothetical protein
MREGVAEIPLPAWKKTCRKLGISFWHFLMDRLGIGKKTIAPLHEIITERAALATGY